MANNKRPVPGPGILDIKAYVPGKSKLEGEGPVIKLSSNETPLGPSPVAVAAYTNTASALERYPDGSATVLREAIAARYGLEADRIVCGAGSDELLSLLAAAYLSPGDEAIYTEHGFLVYRIAILTNGATPVVAPEKDCRADVDAILERVSERTRIVFIANPNNPTGTYLPLDEIRRLRAGLPDDVVLVLDAAYAEYVRRNDYDAGVELVRESTNTVMTRTFSKIYGLAAARIGWAYCPPEIADVLNRIRGPFNLTSAAIAAGAAAMEDMAHVEKAAVHNETWLPWLSGALEDAGLRVTPSVGNFLLAHFPDETGKTAEDADAFLQARRIVVRRVEGYGFPNALRITIGTADENKVVAAALHEFMNGTGS